MVTPTPTGFVLDRDECFVICPYNASHQILNDKFARHVSKCREAYKEKMRKEGRSVTMQVCRYNYAHQLPGPELLQHERNCPNRSDVVTFVPWKKTPEGRRQLAAQGGATQPKNEFHVDPAAGDETDNDAMSVSTMDGAAAAGPSAARSNPRRPSMGQRVKPSSGAEDEADWDTRVQLLDLKDDVDELEKNWDE